MSLHIHRSERANALAEGLAGLLSRPLADPFASEVVAVPTRGVERWLAQTLAGRLGAAAGHADGVCAGVEFTSPSRLASRALAGVLRIDWRDDPWRADRLTWPVLAEVEAVRGEPWASILWAFLEGRGPGGSDSTGRRWATAAHLAELFTRYGVERPSMIRAWSEGRDVEAGGSALGPELAWQAELWRRVRARVDVPSPAERLPGACVALEQTPESTDLPSRLSMFGPTRIDPDQLEVLAALAGHRDVHLWLTHPSPGLWSEMASRIAEVGGAAAPGGHGEPRRDDPTSTVPRHRLLAYLGRDVRELQLRLAAGPTPATDEAMAGLTGTEPGGDAERCSLLARLQDDISADRPARSPAERPLVDPGDDSLQLHVSHGPDRQVEVLREVLLGLLDDDPSLEPRDIVVLCPDIETFAPLIAASFGLDADSRDQTAAEPDHPGHRLRVRLADRSLRRINPLLSVLDRLLQLADSRLPASEVLDLAASSPVARRFGFTDDDLQRMAELVQAAGVRWGLDPTHRARFGVGCVGQNTWSSGLERMLLGVTMDAEGEYFIDGALPLDEVDSSDVDLVGRIAELIARLDTFIRTVAGIPTPGGNLTMAAARPIERHPLGWWMDTCRDALESLTFVPPGDAWQSAHAYGELARLAEQADDVAAAGQAAGLSLADVRSLLADAFRGRATRANFRTGTLTMCTMLPMRSVPHRVICLLGVDDATFPRHRTSDGDDIVALDPWIGDRDPRSEDRQLLLDAVLAATERLIVVYSGIDARTGAGKPVAVPIGELLDALEETARTAGGRPVREQITTRHTLQPFDRDNFRRRASEHGPFSFDRAALRGARAATGERLQARDPFAVAELAAAPRAAEVPLAELVRFFAHPARALLRSRAQLRLVETEDDTSAEQIPIALDGLDSWKIGNRLLQRHLDGIAVPQLAGAEWRRGEVPPGELGSQTLRPIGRRVEEIAAAAAEHLREPAVGRDIDVGFDGRTLTGTVAAVRGDRIVAVVYSWLGAKHRLQAWIELLALTATEPGYPWQAVTVGRGDSSVLGPVDAGFARQVLADLILLYDTGHDEPLPFAPRTSATYARLRRENKSVTALGGVIQREWTGDATRSGERDADYARFATVFPESLEELLAPRARPADVRGQLGEPSRFGSLARRVWQPLLTHEDLS